MQTREMEAALGAVQGLEQADSPALQTAEKWTAQRLRHLSSYGKMEVPRTFKCSKCCDTGYYMVEENGYTFACECECGKIQRERVETKLRFAALPEEFKGQTVDNFRTDCYLTPQNQELARAAKMISRRFVERFEDIQDMGKGLFFYSGVKGSGKTRLAASIANDLVQKKMVPVKFTTALQILDQIRETWGNGRSQEGQAETESQLIQDIVSVPVLIIDDIGVEQPKDWVNERFYNILNGRMIEKRITIFTSNYRMEQLRLDDRIVNRIRKMALPVEFPAESIRTAAAKRENSELLKRLLGT